MICRTILPVVGIFFCLQGCFTTLPMTNSFADESQSVMFQWLAREPMPETFPVNYEQVVRRGAEPVALRARPDMAGTFSLTMLRNAVSIEESLGKPLREKFSIEKQLTLGANDYAEEGSGKSISDVARMKTNSAYSAKIKFSETQKEPFAGTMSEKVSLTGSLAFVGVNARLDVTTEADFLAVRDLESGSLMGLNIPGYPFLPGRMVRPGDQWEVSGYTDQRTTYRYSTGAAPANVAAATLLLLTYQYHGMAEYQGKRCAYIEMFGETYEMRDFGGQSTLRGLKAVAKTMSRAPISEVRDYLAGRSYTSPSAITGSFQASAKLAGYALVDIQTMKVLLAKTGKEALTGGGSSIGMIKGTGKGVFREQWFLENKAEQ